MGKEVLRPFSKDGKRIGFTFWCPGCRRNHGVWVYKPNPTTGAKWTWNGNLVNPTFSPSLHVFPNNPEARCHSFVTDGSIRYLSDSYHELKGTTVQLKPDDD